MSNSRSRKTLSQSSRTKTQNKLKTTLAANSVRKGSSAHKVGSHSIRTARYKRKCAAVSEQNTEFLSTKSVTQNNNPLGYKKGLLREFVASRDLTKYSATLNYKETDRKIG